MVDNECYKYASSTDNIHVCRNLDNLSPQNYCWETGTRICKSIENEQCRNATTGECKQVEIS
jgi:hypothetical protein